MNRSLAPIGSLLAAAALTLVPLTGACADESAASIWALGSQVILAQSTPQVGDRAVATSDPGLQRFLTRVGAHISYQPGQQYIVVTRADHRSILFTIGEKTLRFDGVDQDAPFVVREHDGAAWLPFFALAEALDFTPVSTGSSIVLQPQLTSIDLQPDHGRSLLILHAAVPTHPQLVRATAAETIIRLPGLGTHLPMQHFVDAPGLRAIDLAVTGNPRNPTTTLTLYTTLHSRLGLLGTPDPDGVVLAVAPAHVALGAPPLGGAKFAATTALAVSRAHTQNLPFAPLPERGIEADATPSPLPTPPPVASLPTLLPAAVSNGSSLDVPVVNDIHEMPDKEAYLIHLSVAGQPTFSWHLLGDGRFYVDLPGASLGIPPREESVGDPRVVSLRLRANGTPDAPNVRLALTLRGTPLVALGTDPQGITIRVTTDHSVAAISPIGSGRIGVPIVAPVAVAAPSGSMPVADAAAFAPGTNPRLIVIDPGHGGSDSGAIGNGMMEKNLTLDIARRLRTLLVEHGWQVRMTRDSDVDVYRPDDSAHDELQARCDVANRLGARLFISIHINSFTTSELTGTTTYYYKPQDATFARIIQSRLIADLGTDNDGVRRENFYVVRHTTMPSILVETAFISNPSDADRLRTPAFRQHVAQAISEGVTTYTGGAPSTVLSAPLLPAPDATPTPSDGDDLLP